MASEPQAATVKTGPPEPSRPMTAEELLRLPDDGHRYELIKGELRMMSPAGFEHGRVAIRVGALLDEDVRKNDLGSTCGAETGFLLCRDPDTVLAPDAAFVKKERLEGLEDTRGYLPFAPELAVEVISPSDSFTEVEEKARTWLQAGTRMVLVVDPTPRVVYIYRGAGRTATLTEQDTLEADDVVPGWRVPVRELFV
ncbi:MAG: Uma2 family endonuclease [Planctomycetes bacterium]|nr:Uma2 family endonuclease [Planctomycetota bacterium]